MEEDEVFTFTIPWALAALLVVVTAYQLGRVLGMYHGALLALTREHKKNVDE